MSPLLVLAALLPAVPVPKGVVPETFIVQNPGVVFLGPDGKEKDRLATNMSDVALSPDGRWLAGVERDKDARRDYFALRPRGTDAKPVVIPAAWGDRILGGLAVWSADGKHLLLSEFDSVEGGLALANRVYDLGSEKLTTAKVPDGYRVWGWSPDGAKFLATGPHFNGCPRVAWLRADGTGRPDFLTGVDEVAYGPRLSPSGRRVLLMVGPNDPKGGRPRWRLTVMDLESKARTVVDEPGQTFGHCWSPDGSQVAYTWQKSLEKPGEVPDRETLLITCDPDGRSRKTVTTRKYTVTEDSSRDSIVFCFWVVDWR